MKLPAKITLAAASSGVLVWCWELENTSTESESETMYLQKPNNHILENTDVHPGLDDRKNDFGD